MRDYISPRSIFGLISKDSEDIVKITTTIITGFHYTRGVRDIQRDGLNGLPIGYHTASPMVTQQMTSRDPSGSRSKSEDPHLDNRARWTQTGFEG